MEENSLLFNALIYLLAAVVSVPVAKKMGLGSVIGYLLAGVIIGPNLLALVGSEHSDVMHFAEFGVIIMLFLIGLELHPSMLWRMKRLIFGLGGLQLVITTLLITIVASFFSLNLAQSFSTGLILAISSTAIVLQTLSEKSLLKTRAGYYSFAVLLMQDMAVIPILAVLTLLTNQIVGLAGVDIQVATHVVVHSGWQKLLLIIVSVGSIVGIGRFVAFYVFRFIAESGIREVFTATALLLVVATTMAMNYVGLSPALGAFLAGVVLANSEYRYELENNLEPFKGLLLGLFFISVGSSINFKLFAEHAVLIVGLLTALLIVKFCVVFVLGRWFGLNRSQNMIFAFSLAQAGEFGFVLISFASQNAIYDEFTSGVLLIIVALSMLLTPLLFILNERFIQPKLAVSDSQVEHDEIESEGHPVIIAGYGRFGMVLGRFLNSNGIKSTVIDNNPHNIEYLRKFGYKVFYGDITRPEVLRSAGASEAKVLVIAMGDRAQIDKMVQVSGRFFPHLKLVVRAVDVAHALDLHHKKITSVKQEVFDSAVGLGAEALKHLGYTEHQSHRSSNSFKYFSNQYMAQLQKRYTPDDPHFAMEAHRFSEHLENILMMQQKQSYRSNDCAWDPESLNEEIEKD